MQLEADIRNVALSMTPSASLPQLCGSCQTSLAPACLCYLHDIFENLALMRTKEGKNLCNFYFILLYLNLGMNVALSYSQRSESITCLCASRSKSDFLSVFGNITCDRHSVLNIAVFNEDVFLLICI